MERDAIDYAALVVQVLTLVVTGGGLAFVAVSLSQASKQQRLEAGPYVRIDIGTLDRGADFEGPAAHFRRTGAHAELSDDGDDSVMISAWFRNYQSHSLGMAFGVTAVFLIEAGEFEPVLNDVSIAYLEVGKPVLHDIGRVNRSLGARVTLLSVSYVDFYDRKYQHTYGERGSNALHGRMICAVNGDQVESRPNGRSRGRGVDFGT